MIIIIMSINYNSIKDLVNLLYEFVYEKKKDTYQNYSYEKLNPENITLNELIKNNVDYQVILSNSFGEKQNFKLMSSIFGGLVKKVILKKYFKDFPLTVIIQQFNENYQDSNSINDIYYELMVNQLISEFVIIDNIPFYLLNICNFNLDYGQIKDNSDYNALVVKEFEILDQKDLNKKFCFSVYEHYSSYKTMTEILSMDLEHDDLYNLFFQVLFSHAFINYKLGSFRHGSFNIYSFLVSMEEHDELKLKLGDDKFTLRNVKFICKLFNYRRTEIKGISNKVVSFSDLENPTYDIYIFFKSIYDFSKKNDKNFEKIKIIISNFISIDIIEKKIMKEDEFYNIYTDTIIPIHILLKNNFFSTSINMNTLNSRSIFKKNENKEQVSIGEHSLTEVFSGYRKLSSKSSLLQSGGKKKSTGKKPSKKTLSKKKLSRERVEVREEVDNIDTLTDQTEESDEEFVEEMNRKELEEEDEEVQRRKINPDRENQDDNLMTEGDDNRERVPIDQDIENGKSGSKYMKKSKKGKKTVKKNKSRDDSSTTFDLSDLEGGSESEDNKKQMKTNQSFEQYNNPSQMTAPSTGSSQFMGRQRMGTNKDMSSIFSNLNKGQMIPLLPEMQGMFDINAIAQQQRTGDFSTEEPMGSEPRIMDMGLMRQGMPGMGGPMGMPGMGGPMGMPGMGMPPMGMGGPMGMPGMGMPGMGDINQASLGSASMGMGGPMGMPSMGMPPMGAPMGIPGLGGMEMGKGTTNFAELPEIPSSNAVNSAPAPSALPIQEGAGKKKKNFFLTKA